MTFDTNGVELNGKKKAPVFLTQNTTLARPWFVSVEDSATLRGLLERMGGET
jgi:hypothetical protein